MANRSALYEARFRDEVSPGLAKIDRGFKASGRSAQQATPKIRGAGGALSTLPGPAGAAASALTGPLGIAIAGGIAGGALLKFGADSLNSSRQFERGMREIGTLSTDARANLSVLSGEVRNVAIVANQSLPDATKAMYDMVSAGVAVEDAGGALETAGKLAVAGVTDISTSTDLLTTAVNAWGSDTLSAERTADIMFATVQRGKTTIDQLGQSLFNVAPVAAAAGVSIEEIGAAAATLTAQGTPTSVAMTQMRNAIVELLKPSEKLAPVWKAAGYESGEAAIKALGFAGAANLVAEASGNSASGLLKLVGSQEAVQAILGITGRNLATFTENLDATTNSSGNAEQAFVDMSGTLDFKIGQLQGRFEDLKVSAGDLLLPVVTDLLDVVLELGPAISALGTVGNDIFGDEIKRAGQFLGVLQDLHKYAFRPDSWRLFTSAQDARNRDGYDPINQTDQGGGYANQLTLAGRSANARYVDQYYRDLQNGVVDFTRNVLHDIDDSLSDAERARSDANRAFLRFAQETANDEVRAWSQATDFVSDFAQAATQGTQDATVDALSGMTADLSDFTNTSTYNMKLTYDDESNRQRSARAFFDKANSERAQAEEEAVRRGLGSIRTIGERIAEKAEEVIEMAVASIYNVTASGTQGAYSALTGKRGEEVQSNLDILKGFRDFTKRQDGLLVGGDDSLRQIYEAEGGLGHLVDDERIRRNLQTVLNTIGKRFSEDEVTGNIQLNEIHASNLTRTLQEYIDEVRRFAMDNQISGLISGQFASGGTVPGRIGSAQLAIVHGGEKITPPGSSSGNTYITNNIRFDGNLRTNSDDEDDFLDLLERFVPAPLLSTGADYA